MEHFIEHDFTEDKINFFTSVNQTENMNNDYFFDSSDKINFFVDSNFVKDGALTKDKQFVLNKVGHAIHRDEVFGEFVQDCKIAHVALDLGIFESFSTFSEAL